MIMLPPATENIFLSFICLWVLRVITNFSCFNRTQGRKKQCNNTYWQKHIQKVFCAYLIPETSKIRKLPHPNTVFNFEIIP